jgi:3',5'-cyclic AMP phosphodiesterase CpdA
MLKECGIPVYHVLGNHEADACTKEQSLKYIGWEKSYYSFDIKKKHFVVLDSNYIRTDDGRYVSFEHCNYHYSPSGSLPFVSQEQIEWLENDIVSSPYPTIIFSHHSLSDTVNGVLNRREIWQLFKRMNADRKRVILCMNGHSHIDGLSRHDDVYFLDVNSISNIWIGGKYAFIRYSEEIDKEYPYLKYTTPYRDPLYAIATLSDTEIAIDGVESEFVGPSPYELGMPKKASEFVSTAKISSHRLKI